MRSSMIALKATSVYGAAAFATLAFALFVLIHGWLLGNDATVRLLPNFPAMVPTTAACFALLALALLDRVSRTARSPLVWLTPVLLGVVLAISLGNLALLALEAGLLTETTPASSRLQGDHMSVATSLGMLLCVTCIGLMRRAAGAEALTCFALFGLASSLGALIGPCINPAMFQGNLMFAGLSLPTALLFTLTFIALLIDQTGPGTNADAA